MTKQTQKFLMNLTALAVAGAFLFEQMAWANPIAISTPILSPNSQALAITADGASLSEAANAQGGKVIVEDKQAGTTMTFENGKRYGVGGYFYDESKGIKAVACDEEGDGMGYSILSSLAKNPSLRYHKFIKTRGLSLRVCISRIITRL